MTSDPDKWAEQNADPDAWAEATLAEQARQQLTDPAYQDRKSAERDSTMRAMQSPEGMTRRWLRVAPLIAGTGGALITKNPRGAGLGAEAMAGFLQLLGAYGGGVLGQAGADKLGGTWQQDPNQQAARMNAAGLQQAGLQLPASLMGTVGEGLVGMRGVMRGRAEREAANEVATKMTARRQTVQGELGQRIPAARAARQAAAGETEKAIRASAEKITLGELVDEISRRREARVGITGRTMPDKAKQRLLKETRGRVGRVLRNYSGGVVTPGTVYDMPLAQVSKQAFDDLIRAANLGREGGVRPKPGLDIDVADAFRALIEQKNPGVREMNQRTSKAIRTEQRLMRKKRNFPTEAEFQTDLAANQEVARQVTRNKRSANPLTMFKGIPVRGGVAMPGFTVRPGGLSEFGGIIGEGFASAPAEQLSMWGPRLGALFYELAKAQEEAKRAQMDPELARKQITF